MPTPQTLLVYADHPEADAFISADPLALLIGMVLDQQQTIERAFTAPFDLVGGLIKTLVFGAIIGLIACWHGFFASGGAAGVGKGVNDTVVRATLSFFVANYLLTSAMFAI